MRVVAWIRSRQAVVAMCVAFAVSGCALLTVHPGELQRGDPSAMVVMTEGGPSYSEVWSAATRVMARGMTPSDQDKASGTLRSRAGSANGGKIIAMFISPTSSHASSYQIEILSKQPVWFGQPVLQTREPEILDALLAELRAGDRGRK